MRFWRSAFGNMLKGAGIGCAVMVGIMLFFLVAASNRNVSPKPGAEKRFITLSVAGAVLGGLVGLLATGGEDKPKEEDN